MAVLVAKHPQRRYQSIGSLGVSVKEQERADRLDKNLEKSIKNLEKYLSNKGLMPDKKGKGSIEAYWELGRCLNNVANSDDFENIAELPLLWRNAKMYISEELLYKERGPYREHLWYCFRLGGYPKELVMKMKWGEWVTIFDSSGINQEKRFDNWFKQILSQQKALLSRKIIRMFAPCVNAMLSNIDIGDLSDAELFNCYKAAWHLAFMCVDKENTIPEIKPIRKAVQKSIENNLGILDSVMEGTMSSYEYAITIIDSSK